MDRQEHIAGIASVVIISGVLGGAFIFAGATNADAGDDEQFANAVTIEASLAYKKVEAQKQPQKQRRKQVAPAEATKLTRDEFKEPDEKEEKKDEGSKDKSDSREPSFDDILNKNRGVDDPDLSSTGVEEVAKDGQVDGSEWGTELDAKGEPYAGELKGRLYSVWELPSISSNEGTVLACLRLSEDGKIADRELKKRSSNADLNRSVQLALRKTPDMETPVPEHLKDLLTKTGVCFNMSAGE